MTFDDGWASQFNNALPVLNKYGVPATMYIYTQAINGVPDYMTQAQIQAFADRGDEIASHTVTHADLTTLTPAQLDTELSQSKATLQQMFGPSAAIDFASPYGAYNPTTTAAVKNYYATQRNTDGGFNAATGFDPSNILVQNVDSTTTADIMQKWVNEAKTTNTWLVLVYHEVGASIGLDIYHTDTAVLDAHMAAVKNSGLPMVTVRQGVEAITGTAPPTGTAGGSTAITPTRFLDTRLSSGPVPGGGTVSFQARGLNGVPADASAVVVNLTTTQTQSAGFLTAYASGAGKPNASNVNYGPGQTIPNLAVVPVGPDGKVTIANTSSGSAQVIADVSAYYRGGTPTAAGAFAPLAPTRFLDTRSSSGPVASGGKVSFQVGGVSGIPANASAVVVNLTVTEPTSAGYLTAHASGSAKPGTSNVNYAGGQTVPNLAVVPVGPDGKVTISNTETGSGSSAQVVADVSGYFLQGAPTGSGTFGPVNPARVLDTRNSSGPVPAGGTVSFQAAGVAGVPANAAGVWANLTVTQSTSAGYLTGYASGSARPGSSNVNYATGQTVPNMAYLPIGLDGKVTIANTEIGAGSTVHVIADIAGYQLK
ncbi:polysaccharide deacetylase family protein [Pseudarthrobacter sp. IC2-21]|uniref:polysaccharide deacetylase family protein n=1 Tax=Pseudarthrobacter sp. IC2-21 TaxID=3092262 RepID=UPI002A6B72D6|nr:polysaccharide deacetylase family protein [Pseudarthrobacter sp. IC2-21]